MVATAPAGHDKDAFAIGEIEEFLGLQLAFQANCVQAHVLHIAKFVFQTLRVFAQHHVGRPAAATNQNIFAIDGEQAAVGGKHLRRDFADAEVRF